MVWNNIIIKYEKINSFVNCLILPENQFYEILQWISNLIRSLEPFDGQLDTQITLETKQIKHNWVYRRNFAWAIKWTKSPIIRNWLMLNLLLLDQIYVLLPVTSYQLPAWNVFEWVYESYLAHIIVRNIFPLEILLANKCVNAFEVFIVNKIPTLCNGHTSKYCSNGNSTNSLYPDPT